MSTVNPWVVIAGLSAGFAAWEYFNYKESPVAARQNPTLKHPTDAAFVTTQDNPWDKQERIPITGMMPAIKGLEKHPNLAQKWLLRMPSGALLQVHGSKRKLARKVRLLEHGDV